MEQSLVATLTQMNLPVIFAVTILAALIGIALYWVALGNLRGPFGSKASPAIQPLDVQAFNNLIDQSEEDYLREQLPPSTFRTIQRLRLRAAIDYVICASRNSALLIRMGKDIGPDAPMSQSREASELVNAAVHLRLVSMLVLFLLWVKIAFPGLRLSLKDVSALHGILVSKQASLARINGSGRLFSSL
jgi:hypothetical protein